MQPFRNCYLLQILVVGVSLYVRRIHIDRRIVYDALLHALLDLNVGFGMRKGPHFCDPLSSV